MRQEALKLQQCLQKAAAAVAAEMQPRKKTSMAKQILQGATATGIGAAAGTVGGALAGRAIEGEPHDYTDNHSGDMAAGGAGAGAAAGALLGLASYFAMRRANGQV